MKTLTVNTTSYVEVPDDANEADAEAIVESALIAHDDIYLVTVTRTAVLLSS